LCRLLGIAALGVGVMLCITSSPAHADTPAFLESTSAVTLPFGTGLGVGNNAVACGNATCVAAGFYVDSSSFSHAMVTPASSGVAGTAQLVTLPNGASASAPWSELYGVSCWSSNSCVAVGAYTDSAGNRQPLLVPVLNGVAQPAVAVPLPPNADTGYQDSFLYSVSCVPGGTTCEAVGNYYDTGVSSQSLVVRIDNGSPVSTSEVALPGDAASVQGGELMAVSCWAAGSCEAVGEYSALAGYRPLVVQISGGVPGTGSSPALPANAEPGAGHASGLALVSCWAAGSCAAVGHYTDSSNSIRMMGLSMSQGSPGTDQEIGAPAAASTNVDANQLACSGSGSCLLVGQYETASSSFYAFDAQIVNGQVGQGQDVSLPTDAATSGQFAGLLDASCPPSGSCLAVGYYKTTGGASQPMTLAWSGTTIPAAMAAPAPPGALYNPPSDPLYNVGCGSAGSCAAFGEYREAGGAYAWFAMGAQAPLTLAPAALAAAVVGTPYSAQLSGWGGWAPYGWSISSGQLPAGLSLDATTGVISGTPTTAGTSNFSVGLAAAGSPAQSVGQSFSLTVAAAPSPPVTVTESVLRLATSAAVLHAGKAALRLRCSGGSCAGVVTLEIVKVYTVKHGRRRIREHRRIVIGSAHFTLAAGVTATVSVRINAAGRRALAARRRLAVTVFATIGAAKQTAGHLTLKLRR
jgi:hypothetical protein